MNTHEFYTENVSRGNGYDWDFGKSNNAIYAEEKGLVNVTNLAKALKINSVFLKDFATAEEWHHTSGRFNKTNYYNIENIKEWLISYGNEKYKEWKIQRDAEKGQYQAFCTEEFWEKEDGKWKKFSLEYPATITDTGKSMVEITIKKGAICKNYKFGEFLNMFKRSNSLKFRKNKNGKNFTIDKFNYETQLKNWKNEFAKVRRGELKLQKSREIKIVKELKEKSKFSVKKLIADLKFAELKETAIVDINKIIEIKKNVLIKLTEELKNSTDRELRHKKANQIVGVIGYQFVELLGWKNVLNMEKI